MTLRQEIVQVWLKRYEESPDIDAAIKLAKAHGFYARTLPSLRSGDRNHEAVSIIDEAVSLAREAHEKRDDLAAETLAWTLSQKAAILADVSRLPEAYEASLLSVERTRALYLLKPDAMRRSFAARLIVHATISNWLYKWDEGCEATREAVLLYRALYGAAPLTFMFDLERSPGYLQPCFHLKRCLGSTMSKSL
jgi:hypothetical protein